MANTEFPKSQCISVERLIREIKNPKKRFCFILGAGASVTSGIPTGQSLEMVWMDCLMGEGKDRDEEPMDPVETRNLAENLRKEKGKKRKPRLQHAFEEIEKTWRKAKEEKKTTLPSEYYFDIYLLRFFHDWDDGFRYMENIMEEANCSIGYYYLAQLLTRDSGNNLTITTNFDSLVEDALSLHSKKHPLVVQHESLAPYIRPDTKRPIVAKLHRGLGFEPFNSTEETNGLSKDWKRKLDLLFEIYTPIVVGYGGGDQSLMRYLERNTRLHRLYWCGLEEYPSERVGNLILKDRSRRFYVKIRSFDELMKDICDSLCPGGGAPNTMLASMEYLFKSRTDCLNVRGNDKNSTPQAASIKSEEQENTEQQGREQVGAQTAWSYFVQAYGAAESGQYEKAIDNYTEAIRLKPDYAEAYNNRGIAYGNLKRYEEAIADYNEAIRLKPDDAGVYCNRGNAYDDLCRYEEAIADYTEAIRLKPDDAATYNNRGTTYSKMNCYEKAIAYFTEAIRLKPDYAVAYCNRGNAYGYLGRYKEAIADYTEAIRLKPDDVAAYNNRGFAYFILERNKEAIADYTEAIHLNPDLALVYRNRAKAYRAIGETELAEADDAKVNIHPCPRNYSPLPS